MVSGKSGHNTRLTDGDFIMSPSITNLFESSHGNGILLLEDGAVSPSGNRNTPASLSGAVAKNGTNGLRIKAGYAVIDGMVVDFGNYAAGVNATNHDITLQASTIEGSNTALTDGQSALLVVYVCTNGKDDANSDAHNIQIEMGTAVSSGFPVTPEAFLSDPSGLNGSLNLNSKQSTVLAVVKCVFNGSGGDLDLEVDTVYDMRTFIRHSPIYMAPMTKDTIGTFTNKITSHGELDAMHGGSDEGGALSKSGNPLGALWMSNNENSESILYFSGVQSSSRNTWRLGPDNLVTATTTQTFKVDTGNYFIMTPGGSGVELNPVGAFPKSHVITVLNLSGSNTVLFNESPDSNSGTAKFTLATNKSAIFAYDGNSTWRQAFVSGNVSGAASGVVSSIQLSDGAGNHTSDADVTFLKGEITGVLINNGSGYNAATTAAMTVDGVTATTKISVGDVLRRTNSAGNVIGTVTAVTGTSITIGAGTLATVNNDDPLYREGKFTIDGVANISKPIFGPTGMEFTPVGKNPYKSTAANSLWRNSADSNRLYSGSTKILLDGDAAGSTTFVALTDVPNNFNGSSNKFLQVNNGNGTNGTAVEFGTIVEGDLPTALPNVASIGQSGSSASGILTVNKDLTITGNLIVSGTTTTLDVATINVEDININLGNGVGADADVDGGGITLASTDGAHTILYEATGDSWRFSDHVLPTTNGAKDLGTSSVKWGTLHTGAVSTGTITGTGDVAIDTSVLKVDTSNNRVGVNQATPVASFQVESVGHGYATGTSAADSDAAVAITLFAKTVFRGAKLLISIENDTDNDYETHEAVITHTGGSGGAAAAITVYGSVRTDGSAAFCTFAAQESSGNIQVVITPGVGSKLYQFGVGWKGIAKLTS